jgi:2-phosphoglycerate kinase
MIYLIGGAPRCGKTILAKKIAIKNKISWITTDALRFVILAHTPKTQLKTKFPFEFIPTAKGQYHFEKYNPKTLLKIETTEAKSMWPGVKALIKQFINCHQDYVIEGVHLLPQLVNQFKNTKYWKHIKPVYLIKTDLEKIKQGIPKNKKEFDWILAGGIDVPGRLDKAAQMIQSESIYFAKEAKKYKFKVVNTDTDFNKKINKLF